MNKKLILSLIVSALLVTSYSALAASHLNRRNQKSQQEKKQELNARQTDKQAELNKRQEELKKKREELRKILDQNRKNREGQKVENKQTPGVIKKKIKTNTGVERSELEKRLKERRKQVKEEIKEDRRKLQSDTRAKLQNLKNATPEERKQVLDEIKSRRGTLQSKARELRKNLRDGAKEAHDKFRNRVKDIKRRVKLIAVHGRALGIAKHFRAALARFTHIIKRIDSRIAKLAAKGISTDALTEKIEELKNLKADTEAAIEELKAKYESILDSDTPKDVVRDAKTLAKELAGNFKELRDKIKTLVKSIKGTLVNPVEPVKPETGAENGGQQ